MNTDDFRDYMLQHIRPWAKLASGGKVINCRCFYCSDSDNQRHGHFYINLGTIPGIPLWYDCKKCNTKGIINSRTLSEWNLYDPEVAHFVNTYNKNAFKKSQYHDLEVYNIRNYVSNTELSYIKLQYINDRIGLHLNLEDCKDLKIVLNLKDLLYHNRIQKLTRDPRIIDALNDHFVGFLSHDNAFLNCRKIDDVQLGYGLDKRYINYNIVDKFENSKRFYTIPASINLSDPRPIHLHVAEGPFDILSIYLNLVRSNDRHIFTSIGGSGYKGVIRYFLTLLSMPNIIVHIYPDNDISRNSILEIAYEIKYIGYQVYIHRNVYPGMKDFGVRIENISDSIEEI